VTLNSNDDGNGTEEKRHRECCDDAKMGEQVIHVSTAPSTSEQRCCDLVSQIAAVPLVNGRGL
jgi:hypothetical protein